VLLVAVPPAIAVVPFTDFLDGNTGFSLVATVACYLGALIITPLIGLGVSPDRLRGTMAADPGDSGVDFWRRCSFPGFCCGPPWPSALSPVKGAITNWSFFVVMYTIVGLNREMFLHRPLTLVSVRGYRPGQHFSFWDG